MEERGESGEDLFSVATGRKVVVVPERVTAECLRQANTPSGRVRPPISFNPSNPESTERARQAASRHTVPPGVCGDHCGLPCTLRRLENSDDDQLMATFNVGNMW